MQASSRNAGKCVFCVFRSHLVHARRQQLSLSLNLNHSRLASTSSRPNDLSGRYPPLSFTGDNRRGPPGGNKRRSPPDGNRTRRGAPSMTFDRFAPKLRFSEALRLRVLAMEEELGEAPLSKQLAKNGETFRRVWRAFVSSLLTQDALPAEGTIFDRSKRYDDLRNTFHDRGIPSLDERIKYYYYGYVTGARFTVSDVRNQRTVADLRYPTEWYPATRSMHRTIHLHVGPTNSGKTYHALQRLEQAETGVYAGPLRLLAHEVYTRLNAKGKRCALITGEEKRNPEDDTRGFDMQSCTVEMVPLNKVVDVAVIDEIQMIGNADRGWAWTQALLGVRAKEVHLCGEVRTVPLIQELCAAVGETLVIHRYERLSPLKMAEKSLGGNLKLLRKGDCIVSFSVMGIHALRKQIEKMTGRKVATVYGSLPPETRAQQARLFNDPDNDFDFLVASDAIGMGLNLSIKRVIFETSDKFDGFRRRPLSIADTKQIGGRAGRYRSAHQDNAAAKEEQDLAVVKGEELPVEVETSPPTADSAVKETPKKASKKAPSDNETIGLVTTLENFDFAAIAASMKSEPEPIRTAGLFPPSAVIERFATYFPPGTPFSYILMRMHELSQVNSRFHLCGLKDQLWIADIIEPVQGLTTSDRNVLCACPAGKSDADLFRILMPAFARCIEQQSGGSLLDIPELPLEILEEEASASRDYLRGLERLHKALVAYLWLSYRFAGIFSTRPLAFHVKTLVEEKIELVLSQFSFTEARRREITAQREKLLAKQQKEAEKAEQPQAESSLDGSVEDTEPSFDGQTSYTAGGDRFSGEADTVLMDPFEAEASNVTSPPGLGESQQTGGDFGLPLDSTPVDEQTEDLESLMARLDQAVEAEEASKRHEATQ